MVFKVLKGEDMNRNHLDRIFALDTKVYGPIGEKAGEDFVGTIDNMVVRFNHNKKTFVCLMDDQDNLVGYINFVPVTDSVNDDILNGPREGENVREVIWDDNLGPNEIFSEYKKNTENSGKIIKHNNLFIISVVIDEAYRGKEAVTELTLAFVDYLNNLEKEGYGINSISGIAITADGEKFLRDRMFGIRRFIIQHPFRVTPDRLLAEKEDSIEIVYLLNGRYLEYFLNNPKNLYRKTTKDDVYLFLPYEDSPDNKKIIDLLESNSLSNNISSEEESEDDTPGFAEIKPLLKELDKSIRYEYKTNIAEELERVYLGSFRFLHTSDDYPEGEEQNGMENNDSSTTIKEKKYPYIRGEELVHVSLLTHCSTNMYVVMLCIPNSRYSPSQIEDQFYQGYLMIRPDSNENWKDTDERGFPKYIKLNDYLSEQYGLFQCGDGKALLCSSGIPEDTIEINNPEELPFIEGRKISQEFINILTCETYQSVYQQFFVRNKALMNMAINNRCVYDYYETYMSKNMVAFILKDFSDNLAERMELAATYVFIVELVLFQNTALNKLNKNVSTALSHEGNVSYDYIDGLYRDYAKTIKFWNSSNFKYYGTQLEAEQIRDAFDNEELRDQYNEQQEFLEHMVEVKNARTQERTAMVVNIFGTILSVIGIQEFAVRMLKKFYEYIGITIDNATSTFDVLIIGGGTLFISILLLLARKKRLTGLKFRQPGTDQIIEPKKKKGFTLKKFEFILVFFIISLVFSYLRPLHLGEGGDVTFLSILMLYLIAYFFGGWVGIISAIFYSFAKLFIDNSLNIDILDKSHFIAEIYDYILGYAAVGIGGFFSNIQTKSEKHFNAFWIGYFVSVLLRFIEGVINCSYFYNETLLESIKYCFGYIGVEAIITVLILLIPKVREAIEYGKELAYS